MTNGYQRRKREQATRFADAAYRAEHLEARLRAAVKALRDARSAMSGSQLDFVRQLADIEIAAAEKTLAFCPPAAGAAPSPTASDGQ